MCGARLVRVLVLVLATACRFGFDPPGDGSGSSGDDASSGDGATGDGARTDAAPGVCEPGACATAGGSCVDVTCEITETSERLVTCPAAMPCRVICSGADRPCRDGVACGGATTCDVRCEGLRACQDGVACGDSTCAITCDGEEACEAGIEVGPAGTCTSHCCGIEACALGVDTCVSDSVCP